MLSLGCLCNTSKLYSKPVECFPLVLIYTNNGQTLFRVDHKNPEKFTFHIKKEEQSSINILLIPTWIKGKENFLSLFLWFKIIKIFNKIKNWKYLVRTGKYKLFGSPKKTREKLNPFNSLWTTKQTKKKHLKKSYLNIKKSSNMYLCIIFVWKSRTENPSLTNRFFQSLYRFFPVFLTLFCANPHVLFFPNSTLFDIKNAKNNNDHNKDPL